MAIDPSALANALADSLGQGHHSENRVLILAVGGVTFSFSVLEPAQPFFAEGERPTIKYGVRNNGSVTGNATIRVFDNVTNELLETWQQFNVPAGEAYGAPKAVIRYPMPNRNWAIRFEVTP